MQPPHESTTPPSPQGPERDLSTLLNQEYYLTKILEHLVDDGLHECRRVCRKWCEVCNRLPVKLVCTDLEKVHMLSKKFPNARELDLKTARFASTSDQKAVSAVGRERSLVVEDLLSHLRQFERLETLKFWSASKSKGGSLLLSDALGEGLQLSQQLNSLNVVMTLDEDDAMYFASQLRQLTNLTSLTLRVNFESFPIEPFTELQKIEKLNAPRCLTTQDGRLLFPALTNLTHLNFDESETTVAQYRGGVLEMMLPYASSLKSAFINCSCEGKDLARSSDWSLFKKFTRLAALTVWHPEPVPYSELREGLKYLSSLTYLHGVDMDQTSTQLAEDDSLLTGLRDLHLHNSCDDVTLSKLSQASQLTRLFISVTGSGAPLVSFTGLAHLGLFVMETACVDLSAIFIHMPLLHSLDLCKYGATVQLPSTCFSRLTNLASLRMCAVELDSNLFPALAQLKKLTELEMSGCHGFDSSSLSEISVVTSLKKLNIERQGDIDPLSYISEGGLSRLRYLEVDNHVLTPEIQSELFRRLPSLRKILIPR